MNPLDREDVQKALRDLKEETDRAWQTDWIIVALAAAVPVAIFVLAWVKP